MRTQRRGKRIAMEPAELTTYLSTERTCRVATVGVDGPHVAPLWFFWDGTAIWLNSLCRSQRWADLQRDPRIALVLDSGETYGELRGVEILGRATPVGEVPRRGLPNEELAAVEHGFAAKYRAGSTPIQYDGRHAWLRVDIDKMTSWDFRKIPASDDSPATRESTIR